ncbi:hypothetical protein EI94DRAFT_1833944 [Lactarius quietus]|nr:hypothetical protein EI94DRAFT_1833944 [Lactarius quietus]
MLTPFLSTTNAPPARRHTPVPFHMSSHRCTNNGRLESNLYIREENHCRWRLPLWLLLFSGMVSALTLSYLLTGTVYPNSWTRFSSESLGMLTAAEGFYNPGQKDNAVSGMLEPVSHAEPDHVFARISKSGDITMVPTCIRRPSPCGPAALVDNTFSLLVQVRMPRDTPHGARCAVTSGITLARWLEVAGKAARVQMWSLVQTTPDASAWDTMWDWGSLPQREVRLSSFDARPGSGLLLYSAEFPCPPPSQSLQMFEIACAGDDGDDDGCAVDVWQDLFKVEIRV